MGVVGRNGSGKSTLLRAIGGLLPPASGAVYAQGQPSFLGVNAALMSNLTGERNVELGCLAMGMTRQQARAAYPDIVEFSGVGDFKTCNRAIWLDSGTIRMDGDAETVVNAYREET